MPMPAPLAAYPMLSDTYQTGDVPLQTYHDMRVRDPIVRFACAWVQRSVRKRLGEYRHDDERVQDWVTRCVMPAVQQGLRGVLSALYYGVSLAEMLWDTSGELRLSQLRVVRPERYWHGRGFERHPETGELDTIDVLPDGPVALVDPVSGVRRLVHHATESDWGSPWGEPTARTAYTAWYIKRRLAAFEAIGLEKHGLPTAAFRVDSRGDLQPGETVPGDRYLNLWAQMASASAITVDKDDELQVVPPAWSGASPFDAAIRRLDGYIFNSFYMPYILTQEAQYGTRAQSSVALDAYLMAETDIAEEVADQVVVGQVLRTAVAAQFGPDTDPGTIPIRDASPPDREQWARILQVLGGTGVFDPEVDEQIRWAGELFEVPVDELLAQPRPAPGAGTPAAQRDNLA